jgi:parvulin-like peptidyl-prolyl isomerase
MAEAKKNGVAADSADVAKRLDEYRSSFPSDEAFNEELNRFQQDVGDLEDQFRVELTREAISRLVEQNTGEPTEAQIDSFRTSLAERIRAQHILFMVDETMDESMRRQVMDEARSVLDSARSGVNFGELARRHSDDVGTAQVGGELPWFRRGEMVKEFEDAVFGLESPGDITDHLVETTYGYHIIRLVDRVVDDPIAADSARTLLWKRQVRKAERNLIEGLQANAQVQVNPNLVPGLTE